MKIIIQKKGFMGKMGNQSKIVCPSAGLVSKRKEAQWLWWGKAAKNGPFCLQSGDGGLEKRKFWDKTCAFAR